MEDHIRFNEKDLLLDLLDQRLLPTREERFLCHKVSDVIQAIQTMVVRGAPAIGVTAAFGCALALHEVIGQSDWSNRLDQSMKALAAARPTAVNLSWAVSHMTKLWKEAGNPEPTALLRLFCQEAKRLQQADIASCKAMGHHGLACIHNNDTIMTHCNAGALATAGYGTALGVVRAAHEAGKNIRVIANETRPFLQGARLTAWELHKDGIPVRIACDNACASLMARGLVQCVVVGADRIAANGDTANKIGTFGVGLLAHHFDIPFYVAAPVSTIDRATPTGAAIPIEERPAEEVTTIGGTRITPDGVPVFNFAFDVTPADCIAGIITERGVLRPPYTEAISALFS